MLPMHVLISTKEIKYKARLVADFDLKDYRFLLNGKTTICFLFLAFKTADSNVNSNRSNFIKIC